MVVEKGKKKKKYFIFNPGWGAACAAARGGTMAGARPAAGACCHAVCMLAHRAPSAPPVLRFLFRVSHFHFFCSLTFFFLFFLFPLMGAAARRAGARPLGQPWRPRSRIFRGATPRSCLRLSARLAAARTAACTRLVSDVCHGLSCSSIRFFFFFFFLFFFFFVYVLIWGCCWVLMATCCLVFLRPCSAVLRPCRRATSGTHYQDGQAGGHQDDQHGGRYVLCSWR